MDPAPGVRGAAARRRVRARHAERSVGAAGDPLSLLRLQAGAGWGLVAAALCAWAFGVVPWPVALLLALSGYAAAVEASEYLRDTKGPRE